MIQSLKNLKSEWYPLLHQNAGDVPAILVGTKKDLIDNDASLDFGILNEYRSLLGAKKSYMTSSKTGLNIETIFKELVREILKTPPYSAMS